MNDWLGCHLLTDRASEALRRAITCTYARPMAMVRVVVVDDHGMVRDGLVAAIGEDERLDVVGAAATLAQGVELCQALDPDVVVCDQQLPDGSGSDLPAALGDTQARVLLVSGVATDKTVGAAVSGGCAGFVAKTEGVARLVSAIDDLMADRAVFPAGLLARFAAGSATPSPAVLTPREQDVINLLADAKGSQEIADELVVSLHTARNHIRSVLSKLGATTRLEAVVKAARSGVVDLSPTAAPETGPI